MTISDDYAAELISKIRATIDRRDELTAEAPVDPRDLLLLKLYDDLHALRNSVAFLGGIKPVQRVG